MDPTTSQNVPPRARTDAADRADEDAVGVLNALRASIDNLDAAIIHLLAERF